MEKINKKILVLGIAIIIVTSALSVAIFVMYSDVKKSVETFEEELDQQLTVTIVTNKAIGSAPCEINFCDNPSSPVCNKKAVNGALSLSASSRPLARSSNTKLSFSEKTNTPVNSPFVIFYTS